jgi:leucyl aminopeptidase (aminopeptidase T)
MVEKAKIVKGVINMLKVNMGLKDREKVVVVTDIPTVGEWKTKAGEKLAEATGRAVLAKMVSEIASEKFPKNTVEFFTYPSVGKHGTYPGKDVEEEMKSADVSMAITTYSLTHTDARVNSCKAGGRVASMPMFTAEMFYPGGPMAANYLEIERDSKRIAELITNANEVRVTSKAGTDITFSVKGRNGMVDAGNFTAKGAWGNLPSGEAACAPVEGTASGKIVVEPAWYPDLTERMTLEFRKGYVVDFIGGGKIGDEFRNILDFSKKEEPYISRRNLAELGIGTNPNAKRPDNILEAEKIKGTVHLAIGDNSHMGGKVAADLHQDFVISKPTLMLDGKLVMKNGQMAS